MKLKKYLVLGLTTIAVSSLLIGCSSKDVKVNREIQNTLENKIEESIGECSVEFGDSNVCGFEFKDYDNYDEVLFVKITLKDKSLDSLSKDELKKYGRSLYYSKIHEPIHILYDKYMSNKDSYLYVLVEDSKDRVVTCDYIDNTQSMYYKSNKCPLCNISQDNSVEENKVEEAQCYDCGEYYPVEDMYFNGRSYHCGCKPANEYSTEIQEESYCGLCGDSYPNLTHTYLPNGEEAYVCPTCLDSLNNIEDNIDLDNAN